MKKLKVAFYWHMHQPYYKDPIEERYILPWVRLHSLKGYYDMPLLLDECLGMKLTFNIVPSLVRQIRDYTLKGQRDIYFTLSMKKPEELEEDERVFILRNFFMCHWGNMIHPWKRYAYLLRKRGNNIEEKELKKKARLFTAQEMLDLQVWFNLAWFGYKAERKYPLVKNLRAKGHTFTQKEKEELLETHIAVMGELMDIYKRFQDEGSAELTTSPYYHPILPLVYDNRFALRCMPSLPLNNVFSCPDDARAQVLDGVAYHTKIFGKPPKGMWPSEGSVSPEIIPIFREAGLEWMATDQDILFNSLNQQESLFQAYSAKHGGSSIKIVFRDRGLSDLIGFTYAGNKPKDAVSDFIRHLHAILQQSVSSIGDPGVFIILDGENAWEHYPDGGEEFLTSLYRAIVADPLLEAVTVSEYLEGKNDLQSIDNLYTGSWIAHNFQIWIGSQEDRTGWDYLRRTRKFFEEFSARNPVSEEKKGEILKFLHRAEGSDWFWWYGDEFSSENKEEFDALFRKNLMMVYSLLDEEIPDFLKSPIAKKEERVLITPPVQLITPVIDGEVTNYFEWFGAGNCETLNKMGAMHQKKKFFKDFEYGYNNHSLFLKIEYEDEIREMLSEGGKESLFLRINFENARSHVLEAPLRKKMDSSGNARIPVIDKQQGNEVGVIATGVISEIELSFASLMIEKNEKVHFSVELWKGKLMLCQFPHLERISVQMPDEYYNQRMWVV